MVSGLFITSCAIISNSRTEHIMVHTEKPSIILVNADSIRTKKNKVGFDVVRQRKPVEFTVVTDSGTNKITLNYRSSFAYYANIFMNYGIGMLVDKNNPKRYGYPNQVHITKKGMVSTYYGRTNNKGDILLHFSVPYANAFYFAPDQNRIKSRDGFFGFSGGLDYFYNEKQYISLYATTATNFEIAVPAPVDYFGEHDRVFTTYFSFLNNHIINRFSVGYGVVYALNKWKLYNPDYVEPSESNMTENIGDKPESIQNRSFGLMFNSYFQVINGLHIGAIYRPTFLRLNTADRFKYEHFISLDVAYKIPLKF